MKAKNIPAFAVSAAVMLMAWLWVGVYADREWRDLHLFVKYRPTLKLFFYAPGGEADPSPIPGKESYLTPEQREEERYYHEFIEQRDRN